ncbi:ATP-binding cassette domain-containing protein [Alginatibacterium sediminis]|uniref:ATP-binding cassette domain-containing protein n=1 Tax=Alginatibacterium sediminis TaxID=2164068 RepID=A0A420EAS2_9ALTE|nr:ABC transporter transmembrane domain-containing protein [Alginatibacterium sediminis]RKF17786.1 ATP-binding cassette domain-containing protein [Alginatibacterium sediminis]
MIATLFEIITLKYQRAIILSMLASTLAYVLSLAVPLSFMAVIDRVLSSNGYASLKVVFVILIVVALCECCIGFLSGRLLNWLGCCHSAEITALFFDKLFSLDLSKHKALSSGEALSRLGEIDSLKSQINEWISQFSLDLVFMLIFIFVAYSLSPQLTLLIILTTPLHLVQYFLFQRSIKRKSDTQFEASIKYHNLFVESVQSLPFIQSSCTQEKAKSKLYNSFNTQAQATYSLSNTSLKSAQLSQGISSLLDALILFFGASLVLDQSLSLGALVAFNMIKDRVTDPLLRMASIWEECLSFSIALSRVKRLMSAGSEKLSGTSLELRPNSVVELSKLSLNIGNHSVLSNINAKLELGKTYCIVGASGAGKSSLMSVIHGDYPDYQGSITVDGKELTTLSRQYWRKQISYVHQFSQLFSISIAENILYNAADTSYQSLVEAAQMAMIYDDILAMEHGFETLIDAQHPQLSGGQIQRIILARAIAEQKPILLLDEATSALDKQCEYKFLSGILTRSRGQTVVIVSHRRELCQLADIVLELENGALVNSLSAKAPSNATGLEQLHFGPMLCMR